MGANNPAREGKQNTNRNNREGNERYERFAKTAGARCALGHEHTAAIRDAIESVVAAGDLLSFGGTSDGGAWVVAVYSNGRRYPQYAHSPEELLFALQDITAVSS